MTAALLQTITADLMHTTDGPVTRFVVIYRAVELAAQKEYSIEAIANALEYCLNNYPDL